MPRIEIRAQAHASPDLVWQVLADVESWGQWAPFDEVIVEHGNEVGQVRRMRSGRITTRERIVAFDPPRRYVYEIVSGLPLRGYVAEILLSPLGGGGTQVEWTATFRPRVPGTGWLLKQLLGRVIRRAADALVQRADSLA